MNPYAVCDKCGHVFYPQLQDQDDKMFFTCPKCHRFYLVLDYRDLVECNWCGKYVRKTDALEHMGKYYCSEDCYNDEGYWYRSNGEILE